MKDEAIGPWEAAGIMGVHWSRPAKMAANGLLSCRIVGDKDKNYLVFSRLECEENYREYVENRTTKRRPRAHEDMRGVVLDSLANAKRVRVAFGDAIGVSQAAELMGVYWTLVPRLIKEGKIAGRVLASGRSGSPRMWIVSRQSCEAHSAAISRLESAGKKRGRRRKLTSE